MFMIMIIITTVSKNNNMVQSDWMFAKTIFDSGYGLPYSPEAQS